jgi:hypothetical protein
MAVTFENFAYSFNNDKGKPVFVPTERTRRIADELMPLVKVQVQFEPHYYHFTKGAHVAALHAHRGHRYFARLDLKNFFYSIGRNRVKAALKEIGVASAEHYAKWSTVRNPYEDPRYSLPYGFPQSPMLATLVLHLSALGTAIASLPPDILRSVYLDDIALSGDDLADLSEAFDGLKAAVEAANFTLNEDKVREPAEQIDLFNCDLSYGSSSVTDERVAAFYAGEVTDAGTAAFERYREKVATGNE